MNLSPLSSRLMNSGKQSLTKSPLNQTFTDSRNLKVSDDI